MPYATANDRFLHLTSTALPWDNEIELEINTTTLYAMIPRKKEFFFDSWKAKNKQPLKIHTPKNSHFLRTLFSSKTLPILNTIALTWQRVPLGGGLLTDKTMKNSI